LPDEITVILGDCGEILVAAAGDVKNMDSIQIVARLSSMLESRRLSKIAPGNDVQLSEVAMPNTIVLTLPANDEALRREIGEQLAPYAEVHESPPAFGLNEVKLVIEIINGSAGILASAASVGTFLLLLRDRYKKKAEPSRIEIARLGEPGVPLANADNDAVRRIIGVDEK
jgi:hypothetical protein